MSNTKLQPQRRRGEALKTALLDAAWQELQASGYEQFTFENVAKRAGTSKTVLYRRWANRLELVHAALRAHQPLVSGPIPDTGSLRGDLIALLTRMASGMDKLRMAISWGILTDVMSDVGQRAYVQSVIHPSNVTIMKSLLEQARRRGEMVIEPSDRVITVPLDLMRHELIVNGKPPTEAAILAIVDEIFLPLVMGTAD